MIVFLSLPIIDVHGSNNSAKTLNLFEIGENSDYEVKKDLVKRFKNISLSLSENDMSAESNESSKKKDENSSIDLDFVKRIFKNQNKIDYSAQDLDELRKNLPTWIKELNEQISSVEDYVLGLFNFNQQIYFSLSKQINDLNESVKKILEIHDSDCKNKNKNKKSIKKKNSRKKVIKKLKVQKDKGNNQAYADRSESPHEEDGFNFKENDSNNSSDSIYNKKSIYINEEESNELSFSKGKSKSAGNFKTGNFKRTSIIFKRKVSVPKTNKTEERSSKSFDRENGNL